jgi:hypothetical protein
MGSSHRHGARVHTSPHTASHFKQLYLAFTSLMVLFSAGYIIHCTKNSETARSGQAK